MLRNDPAAKDIAAGETIFTQGEDGSQAFVVTSGDIDIEIHGRVVETVGAGGIFGEMALIDRHSRSATARAKSDAKVVPIDQKRFLYLVQNTPFFAVEVMKIMADRLRRMDATL
jgi:CRP-like cAMP-binding protein